MKKKITSGGKVTIELTWEESCKLYVLYGAVLDQPGELIKFYPKTKDQNRANEIMSKLIAARYRTWCDYGKPKLPIGLELDIAELTDSKVRIDALEAENKRLKEANEILKQSLDHRKNNAVF